MREVKRKLKPVWLKCLRNIIARAEKSSQKDICISALDIQHEAESFYPAVDFSGRSRSICYAMRSILEPKDIVTIDTSSHDSTTFTIKYALPRKKAIPQLEIKNIENHSSHPVIRKDKSVQYFDMLKTCFSDISYQKKCIKNCEKSYRPEDEGRTFYKGVVNYSKERYSEDFDNEKQFIVFRDIENAFSRFSKENNLSQFVNSQTNWNINIPKVIDNMIIGHLLLL
jgi:hypothetical protein